MSYMLHTALAVDLLRMERAARSRSAAAWTCDHAGDAAPAVERAMSIPGRRARRTLRRLRPAH